MTSTDLKLFEWQSRSAMLPATPPPRLRNIAISAMHCLFEELASAVPIAAVMAGILAASLHFIAPNVSIWWSVAAMALLFAPRLFFIPSHAKRKCTEALKDWSLSSPSENLCKLLPLVAGDLLAAVREGSPAEIPLERLEWLRKNAASLKTFAQKCADDPRSPWRRRPALRSYLDELALATMSLDQFIDAARACRRHAENPRREHVDALRKLAASGDVDTLFRDYLLRLAAKADRRLRDKEAKQKQQELEEQMRQEAKQKEDAIEELAATYKTRRNFLLSRDSHATQLQSFVLRLENHTEILAELRRFVQRLPSPANRRQLDFVARWSQANATLLAETQTMSRAIAHTEDQTSLDATTSSRQTLNDSYRVHLRSLLLLDGLMTKTAVVPIPGFTAGPVVAILEFLKYFSQLAATNESLAELWPIVDESGHIYFYYFGPAGPGNPAFQSFSCQVRINSFGPKAELHATFRIPFGFEMDKDPSCYEYVQENISRGNLSKRFFRIDNSRTTVQRKQRRFEWFSEKKATETAENKSTAREYGDEHTAQTNSDGTDHTKPMGVGSATREEINRIRKAAIEEAKKHGFAEEFQVELKRIEEETTGSRKLDVNETIEETEQKVTVSYFSPTMKAPDLFARADEHPASKERKVVYDLLERVLANAKTPLRNASDAAWAARRNGQSMFTELDEAFWAEVRKYALLRSDFEGCPFVEVHNVPYDGRPVQSEPVVPLEEFMGFQGQAPQ